MEKYTRNKTLYYDFSLLPSVRFMSFDERRGIKNWYFRSLILGQGPSSDLKENIVADMLGCATEDLARAYTGAIYSPDHAVSRTFQKKIARS